MNQATCISESIYHHALTYGKKYLILATQADPSRPVIKILGDNGRVRWFPSLCFDLSGADVPLLETIDIRDDPADSSAVAVEVHVTLSNGEERWCFFVTPHSLSRFGEYIHGTNIQIHYGAPHMIVIERFDQAIIEAALRHIERHGELLACTKSITE